MIVNHIPLTLISINICQLKNYVKASLAWGLTPLLPRPQPSWGCRGYAAVQLYADRCTPYTSHSQLHTTAATWSLQWAHGWTENSWWLVKSGCLNLLLPQLLLPFSYRWVSPLLVPSRYMLLTPDNFSPPDQIKLKTELIYAIATPKQINNLTASI